MNETGLAMEVRNVYFARVRQHFDHDPGLALDGRVAGNSDVHQHDNLHARVRQADEHGRRDHMPRRDSQRPECLERLVVDDLSGVNLLHVLAVVAVSQVRDLVLDQLALGAEVAAAIEASKVSSCRGSGTAPHFTSSSGTIAPVAPCGPVHVASKLPGN